MYDMAGWYELAAKNGLTPITAIADPHLTVNGDNVRVPKDTSFLGMVYAISPSMVQCQLRSPALRKISDLDIDPKQGTPLGELDLSRNVMQLKDYPIALDGSEDIQYWVDNGNNIEANYCVINFMDKIDPVPAGPMRTIRTTSTQLLAIGAWTNCALVFPTVLPAGRYAVIGFKPESNGCIAARLFFNNQSERPGAIGYATELQGVDTAMRFGNCGLLGEFEHDVPPTVDFLSNLADVAETVHLDVVQIRAGPA